MFSNLYLHFYITLLDFLDKGVVLPAGLQGFLALEADARLDARLSASSFSLWLIADWAIPQTARVSLVAWVKASNAATANSQIKLQSGENLEEFATNVILLGTTKLMYVL